MLSIYTSLYNVENGLYNWQVALSNFKDFADEVVVATTTDCKDNTVEILKDYCHKNRIKIVTTDIPFSDYAFDGKLKDAALQETTQPGKILLDSDETIPKSQKPIWTELTKQLCQSEYEAIMIASIDLCKSINHYKSINYKFYLHKEGIKRGIVNYARLPNGKIDHTKSDTTDPIHEDGTLAAIIRLPNDIESLRKGNLPYVFHDWGIDLSKRIEKNKWWLPTWGNRAGKEVKDIVLNEEDFGDIKVFEHNLPLE